MIALPFVKVNWAKYSCKRYNSSELHELFNGFELELIKNDFTYFGKAKFLGVAK